MNSVNYFLCQCGDQFEIIVFPTERNAHLAKFGYILD